MLSLTRILKEAWLFGRLNTMGTSKAEKEAEEYAIDVAERLRKLVGDDTPNDETMGISA